MGAKEVMESHLQCHRALGDHRNERLFRGIHRMGGGVHRNKLSYGSGLRNHLDREEFCE